MRELLRALQRLAARHDLVDEPDLACLVNADAPARDDQLHRLGEADDERQPDRHAVAADDVPAPLERSELGVLGGDADVGEQRRLEPGGERVAIDRGDHRLEDVDLARVAALAGRVVQADAERVVVAELVEIRGVLEVPAGTERRLTSTRDHEHERVVVVAEPLPRVVQLAIHHTVDRVVLLRPVVGQRHNVISLLETKRLIVHS